MILLFESFKGYGKTELKTLHEVILILTSMMAAALLSRCLYRSLSTSLSFFKVFLLGCRSIAWKFTGSPYLEKHIMSTHPVIKSFSICHNTLFHLLLHRKLKDVQTLELTPQRPSVLWCGSMRWKLHWNLLSAIEQVDPVDNRGKTWGSPLGWGSALVLAKGISYTCGTNTIYHLFFQR